MSTPYDCDKHPGQRGLTSWCPDCAEAFANRRNPDDMTGEERAAEAQRWVGKLTIPFADLHQRYEELVGRGIFTHEFAHPDSLIDEARTRQHPTPAEILAKLPSHVRVIAVDAEGRP